MRLIDVEPLEELIKQHLETTDSALFFNALSTFARLLEMTPTADAMPVVRCKDCKHRDPEDKKCDCGHAIQWQLPRDDDWFCADGERKDDDGQR